MYKYVRIKNVILLEKLFYSSLFRRKLESSMNHQKNDWMDKDWITY